MLGRKGSVALFKTILDNYVESMYTEIMHSEDKNIKRELKKENKVFNEAIPMYISLYRVEIKLRGLEEYCNRTLLIPATCTLAEFCYAILAAFGVDQTHCFELFYKKDIFRCKAL